MTDVKIIGKASCNQANCKFGKYAGIQCLSNCVIYSLYSFHNNAPINSTLDLDEVLEIGAKLDNQLREKNVISGTQMAQLTNIPGEIIVKKYGPTKIFFSMEIFGMISTKAVFQDPSVMSLLELLEKTYTVDQYIIVISNFKSISIIIKNKTFFIFDPHCEKNNIEGPARVLETKDAISVSNFIGEPKHEYTCLFLYFIPKREKNIEKFLLETYEVIHPITNKIKINLTDALAENLDNDQGMDVENDKVLKPSTLSGNNRKRKSRQSLYLSSKSSRRTIKNVQPVRSHDNEDSQSDNENKSFNFTTAEVSGNNMEEIFSSILTNDNANQSNPFKTKVPFTSNTGTQVLTPVLLPDNDPFLSMSEDSDNEHDQLENEQMMDEEKTLQDTRFSSLRDRNYHTLDFTVGEVGLEFTRLNSLTNAIKMFTYTDPGSIIDKETKITYRAMQALENINKVITSILLNQGIAYVNKRSSVLSLLVYLIIWGHRLKIPTTDMELLLKTKLNLKLLLNIIPSDTTQDKSVLITPELINNLNAKLHSCLKYLSEKHKEIVNNLLSYITKKIEFATFALDPIDIEDFRSDITEIIYPDELKLGKDPSIIMTRENMENIILSFQSLSKIIISKNGKIRQQEDAFILILHCLKNFKPHPIIQEPFTFSILEKTKALQITATEILNTLTERVNLAGEDYLEYLNNQKGEHVITNFGDVLGNIHESTKTLQYCEKMGLQTKDTESIIKKLIFLGQEMSGITDASWPFHKIELKDSLPIFNKIENKIKEINTYKENDANLTKILDNIESILNMSSMLKKKNTPILPSSHTREHDDHSMDFEGDTGNPETDDDYMEEVPMVSDDSSNIDFNGITRNIISINILENYVTNAGAIVGAQQNPRFITIKNILGKIVSSKNYIMGLIESITFYNIDNYITSLWDAIQNLVKNIGGLEENIQKAINSKLDSIIEECLTIFETGTALTVIENSKLIAIQKLAEFTDNNLKRNVTFLFIPLFTIFQEITELTQGKSGNLNKVKELCENFQTELAKTEIEGKLKRRLYTFFKKQKAELDKIYETAAISSWSEKAENLNPSSIEDITSFLETAPNNQLKMKFEKILLHEYNKEQDRIKKEKENNDRASLEALNAKAMDSFNKLKFYIDNFLLEKINDQWLHVTPLLDESQITNEKKDFTSQLIKTLDQVVITLNNTKLSRIKSLLGDIESEHMEGFEPTWINLVAEKIINPLSKINNEKLITIVDDLKKNLSGALQAAQAATAAEATAGTNLQFFNEQTDEILSSITDRFNKIKLDIKDIEKEFLSTIQQLLISKTAIFSVPKIELPKKSFLSDNELETIVDIPDPFLSILKERDAKLMKEGLQLKTESEKLMQDSLSQIVNERSEKNRTILAYIENQFKNGPNTFQDFSVKINDKDPISLFEKSLISTVNKLSYHDTVETLNWLIGLCKSIIPILYDKADIEKIQSFLNIATSKFEENTSLLNLEKEAIETDDIKILTRALNTLDYKRITGGKQTWDQLLDKKKNIENLISDAQSDAEMSELISSIKNKSDSFDLNTLFTLSGRLKSMTDLSKTPKTKKRMSELLKYINKKREFIQYYETSQNVVFSLYPLSETIYIQSVNEKEFNVDNSVSAAFTKIAFLCLNDKFKNTTWIECIPEFDPIKPAFVSFDNNETILAYVPTYENIFDLVAANFLQTSDDTIIPNIIKQWDLNKDTLIDVKKGRLHTILTTVIASQWNELEKAAPHIVDAYVSGYKLPKSQTVQLSVSTIIYIHAMTQCAKQIVQDRSDRVIFLNQQQWILLLTGLFPHIATLFLNAPSFSMGIQKILSIVKKITNNLHLLILNYNINKSFLNDREDLPITNSYLLFPEFWSNVNLLELMWEDPSFLSITGKNKLKSRACLLLTAAIFIDELSLLQLWNSLQSVNTHESTDLLPFKKYLKSFLKTVFGDRDKFTIDPVTINNSQSSYGISTNNGLKPSFLKNSISSQVEVKFPITAFELVIGSIFFGIPIQIFSTTGKLFKLKDIGDVQLASSIINCNKDVEPFKSILTTVNYNFPDYVLSLKSYMHGPELNIFIRQAMWLKDRLIKKETEINDKNVIVLVNVENEFIGAYENNSEKLKNRDVENIRFTADGQSGFDAWPKNQIEGLLASQKEDNRVWGIIKQYSDLDQTVLNASEILNSFPPLYSETNQIESLSESDSFKNDQKTFSSDPYGSREQTNEHDQKTVIIQSINHDKNRPIQNSQEKNVESPNTHKINENQPLKEKTSVIQERPLTEPRHFKRHTKPFEASPKEEQKLNTKDIDRHISDKIFTQKHEKPRNTFGDVKDVTNFQDKSQHYITWPSIKHNFLTIEDIIKDISTLTDSTKPVTSPINEGLSEEPLNVEILFPLTFDQSIQVIREFINQIQYKISLTTNYFISQIYRIKTLYL